VPTPRRFRSPTSHSCLVRFRKCPGLCTYSLSVKLIDVVVFPPWDLLKFPTAVSHPRCPGYFLQERPDYPDCNITVDPLCIPFEPLVPILPCCYRVSFLKGGRNHPQLALASEFPDPLLHSLIFFNNRLFPLHRWPMHAKEHRRLISLAPPPPCLRVWGSWAFFYPPPSPSQRKGETFFPFSRPPVEP